MGFESYHPAINLLWFAGVIAMTIAFRQPVFLAISVAAALAYSLQRRGARALGLNLALLVLAAAFALYYAGYHHFGVTVLRRNFIGNSITAESLLCGLTLGLTAAAVVMWLECLCSVFTADKVVYLFGRVSPRLSLVLSILLRLAPRTGAQAKKLSTARQGVGLGGGQGRPFQRLRHGLAMLSALITWLLDYMAGASGSMRSRGQGLRGRTAFSIYRFDNRDRMLVIGLFCCLTVGLMGYLLGQTGIRFSPRIILNPITPLSGAFYLGHALFCLLPLGLELTAQWRFRRLRSGV